MQTDNQSVPLIKPEIRADKVQALIINCWKASTSREWRQSQVVLISLMKIADGEFLDDIYFLSEIASQRQTMYWNEEMEAYVQAGPV